MTVNLKSNGKTRSEQELLLGDTQAKNQIDENYYFHLTPLMQEIFADRAPVQHLTVFRNSANLAFDVVDADSCPKRKLSKSEYDAFPDKDKDPRSIIPRALLSELLIVVIFLIFLIAWIVTFKPAMEQGVLIYTSALPIIGSVLLFIFMGSAVRELKKRQVTTDSEAAFGKAAFFRDAPDSGEASASTYYVDVALYDEKLLVKRVFCSRRVFDMLSQDRDVVIYGGRVYAYDKDGRLIAE